MFNTISLDTLSTVTGGINEQQLRSLAQENCPVAYSSLKNVPLSKLTRASVQPCLDELGAFKRAIATPQVDAFFANKK